MEEGKATEQRGLPDGAAENRAKVEEYKAVNKTSKDGPTEEASQDASKNRRSSKSRALSSRPRTAMGETVGTPLSRLGDPTPGPQYVLNETLTRPSSPAYSIKGPYRFRVNKHPGPDRYNTRQDSMWKTSWNKYQSVGLKAKGETAPYHERYDYHVRPGPGAGEYYVRYTDTARHAPSITLGKRHIDGLNAGHPSRDVQPVDTHGFMSPSPDYWPEDVRGPEHLFGHAFVQDDETPGLGPQPPDFGHGLLSSPTGIAYSLAGRFDSMEHDSQSMPGPADYHVQGTMGSGLAKSLASRHKIIERQGTPGPGDYYLRQQDEPPSFSLQYKEFERALETRPSPNSYLVKKASLPENPQYTHRPQCRPVWPDILHYPKLSLMLGSPSANQHGTIHDFSKNDKPAYSMRVKHAIPKNTNPAPNRYNHAAAPSHAPRVTACIIGEHLPTPANSRGFAPRGCNEDGPGPTMYSPQFNGPSAPAYSASSRHPVKQGGTESPGPAQYSIQQGQTSTGRFCGKSTSFKGRQSPFVYQGPPLRPTSVF